MGFRRQVDGTISKKTILGKIQSLSADSVASEAATRDSSITLIHIVSRNSSGLFVVLLSLLLLLSFLYHLCRLVRLLSYSRRRYFAVVRPSSVVLSLLLLFFFFYRLSSTVYCRILCIILFIPKSDATSQSCQPIATYYHSVWTNYANANVNDFFRSLLLFILDALQHTHLRVGFSDYKSF